VQEARANDVNKDPAKRALNIQHRAASS